jgi:hypothetical protein
MYHDDDNIRHYAPQLRRVIILVAVIVAVPVMLWTITAFMRTYVAPPKGPTFRPLATAALITPATPAAADSPATTASLNSYNSQPSPVIILTKGMTADASSGPVPDPQAPTLGDRLNNGYGNAPASTASVVPMTPTAVSTVSAGGQDVIATQIAAPADPAPPPWPSVAGDAPPPSADEQAEAVPAGEPIVGPVPLPHPRPREFAMAATSVPMPRPRPAISGSEPASTATDGPLGWISNIFHQGQQ